MFEPDISVVEEREPWDSGLREIVVSFDAEHGDYARLRSDVLEHVGGNLGKLGLREQPTP